MGTNAILASLLLLSLAFFSTASGQNSCSCKATDGPSAAQARCPKGCSAICSHGDSCYAGCGEDISARVSLILYNKDARTIAASLSQQSGRRITFTPRRKSERFNLELKNDPIWNVLSFLNKRGKIVVDGVDFNKFEELRRAMLKGGRAAGSP